MSAVAGAGSQRHAGGARGQRPDRLIASAFGPLRPAPMGPAGAQALLHPQQGLVPWGRTEGLVQSGSVGPSLAGCTLGCTRCCTPGLPAPLQRPILTLFACDLFGWAVRNSAIHLIHFGPLQVAGPLDCSLDAGLRVPYGRARARYGCRPLLAAKRTLHGRPWRQRALPPAARHVTNCTERAGRAVPLAVPFPPSVHLLCFALLPYVSGISM